MKLYLVKRLSIAFAIATASVAIASSSIEAQWASSPSQAQRTSLSGHDHDQVISGNPFGILYGMFTVEFERRINNSLTLATSGTYWEKLKKADDFRYNSINLAMRFYPMENSLQGFSISPMIGMINFKEEPRPCGGTTSISCDLQSTTNATVGVQVDYNWLLGPSRRFALGTGIGGRRILGSTGGNTTLVPSMRFNIGYAF